MEHPQFLILEAGNFPSLRQKLGKHLISVSGRGSAAKRAYGRLAYLRDLMRPIEPIWTELARANLERKLIRFPILQKAGGLIRAYLREKAMDAKARARLIQAHLEAYPEAIVLIHNGTNIPDSVLEYLTRDRRRLFVENGYFKGSLQIDPIGVNAGNSVSRDPDSYAKLPRDAVDVELNTRRVKHRGSEEQVLPAGYIFVPFQVESDMQITRYSNWVKSMPALYDVLLDLVERHPTTNFVIKEHPNSRNVICDKVRAHPRIIFQNGRDTADLIDGAAAVLTINSTVGIEALSRGRPVITLGDACYNIKGIVQHASDIVGLSAILGSVGLGLDDGLRDRFLGYLANTYLTYPDRFDDDAAFANHLAKLAKARF